MGKSRLFSRPSRVGTGRDSGSWGLGVEVFKIERPIKKIDFNLNSTEVIMPVFQKGIVWYWYRNKKNGEEPEESYQPSAVLARFSH